MTGKLKTQVIFGLLAWGLFAFLPGAAEAQLISNETTAADIAAATAVRLGGQKAVDAAAARAGYSSENIRSVTKSDLKEQAGNINTGKFIGANVKGAANAAAARWKGSKNIFSKVWNVTTGAVMDVFRNEGQIAKSLEDYRTASNSENIDKAIAAANEREKQIDSAQVIASAAAVYESPDGQKVYMDANMKTIGGVMDGCVPLPLKLEQSKKCILCPLFGILFSAAQSMSKNSYDMLAQGFINLMLIGFGLYVAYATLKQVSSFTKQDGPKYITDLLTIAFKVLLAYLILKNVSQLYELVLEPLLGAAMEFGAAFLFRSSTSGSDAAFMTCASSTALPEGMSVVDGFYSTALFAKVNCFVTAVQQELAVASSIGSSMMCVARNEGAGMFGFPDFSMMLSGIIIWVFAWLVTLAFGFYLIDAVVRLGVIGGLMPFLIAAWPFKITSDYTKKGWGMFMNTFFTFVFLGLVVSVNIELGLQSMTGGEGGAEKIMELVNANEVKPLLEIMDIGLMGLLFMILCCIFGFKLCAEAISLASQMSSAPQGSNIGSKIGSLGAGAAKWGATKTLKGAGRVGKDVGGAILERTGVAQAARDTKEAIGHSLFKGANFVGSKLGLAGAGNGGSGGGNGGNGGSGSGGSGSGGGRNSAQSTQGPTPPGGGGNGGGNGGSGNGGGNDGGSGTTPIHTNSESGGGTRDNNRSGGDDDTQRRTPTPESSGDDTGSGSGSPSTHMNSETSGGNGERPEGDGGASTAEPRSSDSSSSDAAEETVNDSKKQIADEAEKQAESHSNETENKVKGKAGTAQKNQKGGEQNSAELRKLKQQVEDLQNQLSTLEDEKTKLQKKLRGQNAQTNTTGNYDDNERIKKMEEEKTKLQAQLNSAMEALKNQK